MQTPIHAIPTEELTGHKNCGGSNAPSAVSALNTTGGFTSYWTVINVPAYAA